LTLSVCSVLLDGGKRGHLASTVQIVSTAGPTIDKYQINGRPSATTTVRCSGLLDLRELVPWPSTCTPIEVQIRIVPNLPHCHDVAYSYPKPLNVLVMSTSPLRGGKPDAIANCVGTLHVRLTTKLSGKGKLARLLPPQEA
jgi:hypothetical protein